ncbi:MAG: CoA transferase, partial [Parvibaculum sp.]|uniref:CoA transferase n=1 Tax=Parvibaculum sp. TaxID=2024848 RepID=UPI00284C3A84
MDEGETMKAIFDDLLVIDCASFIAGPAAATIMSDFGARVIKIEPPVIGDSYRQLMKVPGM